MGHTGAAQRLRAGWGHPSSGQAVLAACWDPFLREPSPELGAGPSSAWIGDLGRRRLCAAQDMGRDSRAQVEGPAGRGGSEPEL